MTPRQKRMAKLALRLQSDLIDLSHMMNEDDFLFPLTPEQYGELSDAAMVILSYFKRAEIKTPAPINVQAFRHLAYDPYYGPQFKKLKPEAMQFCENFLIENLADDRLALIEKVNRIGLKRGNKPPQDGIVCDLLIAYATKYLPVIIKNDPK